MWIPTDPWLHLPTHDGPQDPAHRRGKVEARTRTSVPAAGGAKGVRAVSSILGGRDEVLPVALFDSASEGREAGQSLRQTLYASESHLVLDIGPCAGGLAGAEIEDLLPAEILINQLDRWQRAADVPFADEYTPGAPIVPQIEAWAQRNGLTLPTSGWTPELATRVKQHLLRDGPEKLDEAVLDRWQKLFEALHNTRVIRADAAAPAS